jgi:hypothetical protein
MVFMLRPLVTALALGLAAGAPNFTAAGEGEPAPFHTYDQDQLMQQKEDRIGPQSRLETESMVVVRADEAMVVPVERQVVTTRADQNIYQQYGRDSVYAFSPDRKPQKPEQTGPRG